MAQSLATPSLSLISTSFSSFKSKSASNSVSFSTPKVGGLSIRCCARVGGVEIPNNKRVQYLLQYIRALEILNDLKMENKITKDLSEDQLIVLRDEVSIEGDLKISCLKPIKCHHHQQEEELNQNLSLPVSRRSAAILISSLTLISNPQQSVARERRNRKPIPLQDYLTTSDGLKYYDLVEGKGPTAEKGSTVQVHFDCVYNKITAVSSRESKILAGNRTIAQVGAPPGRERKRDFVDNPNGLFSAQAAPKPPSAMYTVVEGMKVGGKRTVIVPPEAGYGNKGLNEIPPGATFDLNLELLQVMRPEGK